MQQYINNSHVICNYNVLPVEIGCGCACMAAVIISRHRSGSMRQQFTNNFRTSAFNYDNTHISIKTYIRNTSSKQYKLYMKKQCIQLI